MKERKSVPCQHSPSCFTCPLRDCVASPASGSIVLLNALPTDFDIKSHYAEKSAREKVTA